MPLLRRNGGCLATLVLVLLLSEGAVAKRSFITYGRKANWSELVTQPSVFVAKALKRLRSRDEGFQPGPTCAKYVGYSYLDEIRKSKRRICGPASYRKMRQLSASSAASSVDCYTAPFAPIRDGGKAAISLCHSRNLVLDTCSFYAGRRGGKLTKKFPMPAEGAVKLACEMANITELAATDDAMGSIAHEVWWSNATRVRACCAGGRAHELSSPTCSGIPGLGERCASYTTCSVHIISSKPVHARCRTTTQLQRRALPGHPSWSPHRPCSSCATATPITLTRWRWYLWPLRSCRRWSSQKCKSMVSRWALEPGEGSALLKIDMMAGVYIWNRKALSFAPDCDVQRKALSEAPGTRSHVGWLLLDSTSPFRQAQLVVLYLALPTLPTPAGSDCGSGPHDGVLGELGPHLVPPPPPHAGARPLPPGYLL